SATFSSTLDAASGFVGPVTFTTSTPGFTIANGDDLKSSGPLSSSGSPMAISGNDSDAYGDVGTWTYSLTVVPVGVTSTITQTSSTTGTALASSSAAFTTGPITVEDNTGTVTFVTTNSSSALSVSPAGLISTSGPLAVGRYSVSGTDSDVAGDQGTWTYTLTVTAVVVAVTFEPNGGGGTMAPQSESQPTALTLNSFTWSHHTFVDWNTSANGTGASFANGSEYPFSTPISLFAQWKAGKAPSKTITFVANGGIGSMKRETNNRPTAISAIRFTRAGYTFVNWNTTAKGSGKSFGAGATYSFRQSVTIFARWKKTPAISYAVTFAANGGKGAMASERHHAPTTLTPNHFTRAGFSFVNWNAAANGSGVSLTNRATYSFSRSITLYAQWKKIKKIAPPPVKRSGPVVGPFALKASQLNLTFESQVVTLADQMKAKGDSQITLLGYGDELSAKDAQQNGLVSANVELGRMRAQSVATYLANRLAAIGLKGWTISIGAASVSVSNSFNAGVVLATLS
ncbi:MAG: Phage-related tail fiber protein, partial [Acidimicrobiaceae bacterium]|nr:Phage-related tail fiber protein [Acidimicrobiaceae bacterium]